MDKLFVELGTLLNAKPEDVKAVIESKDEEKGLGLINAFKQGNKVYKNEDFDTYVSNVKKEHVSELQTLAKKGELPRELHSVIKGSVLEQEQKRIAEQFNITDAKTLDDVIAKIVKTDVNADVIKKEFDSFKEQHKAVISDYETKLTAEQQKVSNELSNIAKRNTLKSLPLEEKDAKIRENQLTILDALFKEKYSAKFDIEKQRLVVYNGDKVVQHEKTLEPLEASEIYIQLGKEFGIKFAEDKSGRGEGGANDRTTLTKSEWISKRMKEHNNQLTSEDYVELNKLFPQS